MSRHNRQRNRRHRLTVSQPCKTHAALDTHELRASVSAIVAELPTIPMDTPKCMQGLTINHGSSKFKVTEQGLEVKGKRFRDLVESTGELDVTVLASSTMPILEELHAFVAESFIGDTWVVFESADKAKDLNPVCSRLAEANPGIKYRIRRPGGTRNVHVFNF